MIGTLLLSACAVGPDYRAPNRPRTMWHEAATAGGSVGGVRHARGVVDELGDPVLSQLVDQAIAGSPTVRQAPVRA